MSLSNPDAMTKAYTEHYALVQKLVPKEQFLELEVGSGDEWENLCRFLEKDVPVGPEGKAKQYPRVNDKVFFIAFRKRMLWRAGIWAAQKALRYDALCGSLLAAGAWCYSVGKSIVKGLVRGTSCNYNNGKGIS